MGKTKKADKALCQKWGIPDFEDVSAYPETYDALILQHFEGIIKQGMVSKEQIESWAWWWEFLRRTQAYRGYWEQHKNKARMHFHSDFDFEGELPDPRKRFYEKDVFICSHLCKSAMQRMTGLNFITHQDDAKSIINLRVDLRKPLCFPDTQFYSFRNSPIFPGRLLYFAGVRVGGYIRGDWMGVLRRECCSSCQ